MYNVDSYRLPNFLDIENKISEFDIKNLNISTNYFHLNSPIESSKRNCKIDYIDDITKIPPDFLYILEEWALEDGYSREEIGKFLEPDTKRLPIIEISLSYDTPITLHKDSHKSVSPKIKINSGNSRKGELDLFVHGMSQSPLSLFIFENSINSFKFEIPKQNNQSGTNTYIVSRDILDYTYSRCTSIILKDGDIEKYKKMSEQYEKTFKNHKEIPKSVFETAIKHAEKAGYSESEFIDIIDNQNLHKGYIETIAKNSDKNSESFDYTDVPIDFYELKILGEDAKTVNYYNISHIHQNLIGEIIEEIVFDYCIDIITQRVSDS